MAKQFTLEQLLPVATTLTAFDAAGNIVPDVAAPALTWTSSDEAVATVSVREDGTVFVTSIAPGTATITATGTLPNGVVVSGSNDVEVLAPVVVVEEPPAPVVEEPAPAPVVEEPAPIVVEEPAPAPEEPVVVVEEPAPAPVVEPVVEKPAPAPVVEPVVEEPAPAPEPAPVVEPVVEEPAPVVVEEPAPAPVAAPEVVSANLAVDFGEPVAKP